MRLIHVAFLYVECGERVEDEAGVPLGAGYWIVTRSRGRRTGWEGPFETEKGARHAASTGMDGRPLNDELTLDGVQAAVSLFGPQARLRASMDGGMWLVAVKGPTGRVLSLGVGVTLFAALRLSLGIIGFIGHGELLVEDLLRQGIDGVSNETGEAKVELLRADRPVGSFIEGSAPGLDDNLGDIDFIRHGVAQGS